MLQLERGAEKGGGGGRGLEMWNMRRTQFIAAGFKYGERGPGDKVRPLEADSNPWPTAREEVGPPSYSCLEVNSTYNLNHFPSGCSRRARQRTP